jgi:hypothetical protein
MPWPVKFMKVQLPVRRAPQGVVGASSWWPTCRPPPRGHWPRSSRGGRATRWTRMADGASTTTLRSWSAGSAREPTSSGRCADCADDPPPHREPGKRRRQVQDVSPDRALDPHGELEQAAGTPVGAPAPSWFRERALPGRALGGSLVACCFRDQARRNTQSVPPVASPSPPHPVINRKLKVMDKFHREPDKYRRDWESVDESVWPHASDFLRRRYREAY